MRYLRSRSKLWNLFKQSDDNQIKLIIDSTKLQLHIENRRLTSYDMKSVYKNDGNYKESRNNGIDILSWVSAN